MACLFLYANVQMCLTARYYNLEGNEYVLYSIRQESPANQICIDGKENGYVTSILECTVFFYSVWISL